MRSCAAPPRVTCSALASASRPGTHSPSTRRRPHSPCTARARLARSSRASSRISLSWIRTRSMRTPSRSLTSRSWPRFWVARPSTNPRASSPADLRAPAAGRSEVTSWRSAYCPRHVRGYRSGQVLPVRRGVRVTGAGRSGAAPGEDAADVCGLLVAVAGEDRVQVVQVARRGVAGQLALEGFACAACRAPVLALRGPEGHADRTHTPAPIPDLSQQRAQCVCGVLHVPVLESERFLSMPSLAGYEPCVQRLGSN